MTRIGLLGGTFDPPHIGHLLLAEYTREALELDTVLFVPAGENPFKQGQIRSDVVHRIAMLDLAIAANPHFQLSRVDIDRPAPHYSADMVQIIAEQNPDVQLYFLMGGDNLRDFPKWTRPNDIIAVTRLAVMRRSDEDIAPDMHAATMPQLAERVDMIDASLAGIWVSSTEVVRRIQAGQSVRYLVPDAVIDYIQTNNLYTEHS